MKRFALAAIMLAGLAAPAWATHLDAGLAAYERGDYATALREWKPLAKQGDADAQYNLGLVYSRGNGVPRDDAEAAKWYRKAAEQGFAAAQFNLGVMYSNGKGVPRDGAEAAKWYRKAAEQGYASAQFNLGRMYKHGNGGLDKSYVQALKWWILAAEQGHIKATQNRYELTQGTMYVTGGPPHMSRGMIEEAEKLAREWKEKHSD